MPPSRPFNTPSNDLDTDQLWAEAVPLAKLVAVVGVAVLVPLVLQFLLLEVASLTSTLGVLFTLAAQFVAAVGTGLVLLYVVARGTQIAAA